MLNHIYAAHNWEREQLQATWGSLPNMGTWQVYIIKEYKYIEYEIKYTFLSSNLWFCLTCIIRQERFIRRWVNVLTDPKVTHEVRSVWISWLSQVRLNLYSVICINFIIKYWELQRYLFIILFYFIFLFRPIDLWVKR